jgi:tight adherence protein B
MSGLAALATGVIAAAVIGAVTGNLPQRRRGVALAHRRAGAGRRAGPSQREWLAQAGADTSPLRLWAGSLALGAGLLAVLTSVTGTVAVAAVPSAAAALAPRAVLARRRTARLNAIRQAWPDALRELAAAVAAGRSLTQALCDVAERGPEPLAGAFASFPTLMRVLGTSAALEVLRDDLADPTTDRIVEVLILAEEQGGRLVTELLRDLADTTTRDLHTAEEVASNALEQKINARAVFVLPWLVLVVLVAHPGAFRDFYHSSAGLVVIAVAAGLSLVGLALASRLSRQPVEPRLLADDATSAAPGRGAGVAPTGSAAPASLARTASASPTAAGETRREGP